MTVKTPIPSLLLKVLNQAVTRNEKRFPPDFMFRLSLEEKDEVIANCDHLKKLKFSRWLPLVFTEHGAIMAANVVNSKHAIHVSVMVVRAFVRMRDALAASTEIAAKLGELEARVDGHDSSVQEIVRVLRQLMRPEVKSRKRIGFNAKSETE